MHPLQLLENHTIKQRKVKFDFKNTPNYWIYDNPFATHLINSVHLILPVGELAMCRIFNEALPYVTDEKLRSDVRGFIVQEAQHSSAHKTAQDYLRYYNYNIDSLLNNIEEGFKKVQSDNIFGFKLPKNLKIHWLTIRVGTAACVEHFTSLLGTWCLDTKPWQNNMADEVMSDLFTWHLAEEVEHRSVAFELYMHLCGENHKFAYLQRQVIMLIVVPIFFSILHHCFKRLIIEDKQLTISSKFGLLSFLIHTSIENKKTNQVPNFFEMIASLKRWIKPSYHPYYEGDTAKAISVLNSSLAVKALNLK